MQFKNRIIVKRDGAKITRGQRNGPEALSGFHVTVARVPLYLRCSSDHQHCDNTPHQCERPLSSND